MLSERARGAIDRTRAARIEIDALIADLAPDGDGSMPSLAEIQYHYLVRVLETVNGNKSAAAKVAKMHRSRLRRLLAREALPKRSGGRRAGAGRPRNGTAIAIEGSRPEARE